MKTTCWWKQHETPICLHIYLQLSNCKKIIAKHCQRNKFNFMRADFLGLAILKNSLGCSVLIWFYVNWMKIVCCNYWDVNFAVWSLDKINENWATTNNNEIDSTEVPIFVCLMGKKVHVKDFRQWIFLLSIFPISDTCFEFLFLVTFQRVW